MTNCVNSNTKKEWTCVFELQELAWISLPLLWRTIGFDYLLTVLRSGWRVTTMLPHSLKLWHILTRPTHKNHFKDWKNLILSLKYLHQIIPYVLRFQVIIYWAPHTVPEEGNPGGSIHRHNCKILFKHFRVFL